MECHCAEELHAGLLPVPEDVDLAIVLKAAAAAVSDKSTPDYLRRAAPMPGFASAALRTLRDIAGADVTPAALEAFAGDAQDGAKVRVPTRIANGHKATLAWQNSSTARPFTSSRGAPADRRWSRCRPRRRST